MNKAEENLIEECLRLFEKVACKQTYDMKGGVIAAVRYYYQSRVKAISDEEIEAKAGCKSDRPYISQDQAIGIGIGIMWFKNKLLKK